MQRTLYSKHFCIVGIIFRSQFTLFPRTDLSVTGTPDSWPYKTFLIRNLYTFCFRQCFKLSSINVTLIFSQFNGFFRHINIKIFRDFQSVYTSMVDTFPRYKDVQKALVHGQKHGCNHGYFCLHMANHLLFTVKISTNQSNNILVHSVAWFFHTLQTLASQWLPNYPINMISCNILYLGSFFCQHWRFDTLWRSIAIP